MTNLKTFYIYIMTNNSRTLYIGVTNNLEKRATEHKLGIIDGFTKKYKLKKLIYFEEYLSINEAIAREKQLKGWLRKKKIALIEKTNPTWKNLSE